MRVPSSPYCRLDLAPPSADRFIFGAAPIDYGPVVLLMPFGFHLAMDTLSSEGFLLRPMTRYRHLLDIAPLIRVPEGLQPSRTTRCSAHTTPAADCCCRIRMNCSTLSHESVTCNSSPAISSTAFDTRPPDLPPASLMDTDLVVICQLVRRRRPLIRFLYIGPYLCSTLPSDPTSR